jgi:fructose-1,6-bisphosphatase/inositol monophosphatase family enzyme
VAGASSLAVTLLGTGFSYQPEIRREQGKLVAELLPVVRDIRRAGSAALDLCAVASGRLDAYFEWGLQPWDFAAGALIAREAGAHVEMADDGMTVAAPPQLFAPLRARLRSPSTAE